MYTELAMLFHDPSHQIRPFVGNYNHSPRLIMGPVGALFATNAWVSGKAQSRNIVIVDALIAQKLCITQQESGLRSRALTIVRLALLYFREIQEGADRMENKPYSRKYGATTAVTLRLTTNKLQRKRNFIADSWVSSVKTLIQLPHRGRCFYGAGETSHKQYPRKFLELWVDALWRIERGSHKIW